LPCLETNSVAQFTACALDEDVGLFHELAHVHTGFDLRTLEIEKSTFIVVSTQGKRDREALTAALTSDAGYVAFVGSRRKAQTMVAQLGDHGMQPDKMARLSAPAGLDIHAIEPVEIALSILGEIVAIRRKAAKDPSATWTNMSDQASKV
jgi:xanthine dehydrogenase accessory factor